MKQKICEGIFHNLPELTSEDKWCYGIKEVKIGIVKGFEAGTHQAFNEIKDEIKKLRMELRHGLKSYRASIMLNKLEEYIKNVERK